MGSPRAVLVAAMVLAALAVAVACGGPGEDAHPAEPTATPPGSTLEDVYSRLAEAITRPEYVFHTVADYKVEAEAYSLSGTVETWIDQQAGLARQETRLRPTRLPPDVDGFEELREVELVVGDVSYWLPSEREVIKRHALICHGAPSGALSTLLRCMGYTESSSTEVQTGAEHEGQPAMALVTIGESYTSDENVAFSTRLYLDQETFLPIASVSDDTINDLPHDVLMRFENDFVRNNDLPSDFFDPLALGYPHRYAAEPLDEADLDLDTYWLGDRFPGEGDYPSLVLGEVYLPDERRGDGFQAMLRYWPEGSDAPDVYLEEWKADEWTAQWGDAVGGRWWSAPCVERKEKVLEDGHAVIFMGYEEWTFQGPIPPARLPETVEPECPSLPFDRFLAQAYLGSTVVVIDAPSVSRAGRVEQSPYDSVEGMEVLLEGLRLRPKGSTSPPATTDAQLACIDGAGDMWLTNADAAATATPT